MIEITSTPIVLIIVLGIAGVILPIISITRKNVSSKLYGAISLAVLISSILFVIYQLTSSAILSSFSEDVLTVDLLGDLFAISMLLVAIMTTVGSFDFIRKKSYSSIYFSLILLSTIGMVLVAYSTDLVMLFVAWELMSIPTYILAGFLKKNPSSNEAALKYFLFGVLSSAIIIYGISITYGITGSTNISEVIRVFSTIDAEMLPLALLAVSMFIAGFGFKMGLVPFHMWLPDTYEGSPPTITALLAAGTKKAGFAAAIRIIIIGTIALNFDWTLALGIIAIMTMTIGNIAAIMQKNLTRMLAYSSIGHAGYILIGLATYPLSNIGLQGSLFHIINHAVMKCAAFIAVTGIIITIKTTYIDKIKGLGVRMPITALGLTISLLALAGVPPLNGFWSKLMLFGAALDAGSTYSWIYWLAIAGVLNSALSLAYYGWVIRKMYFEGDRTISIKEPKSIISVMIFSILFIVGVGVYPDLIIQFTEKIIFQLTMALN